MIKVICRDCHTFGCNTTYARPEAEKTIKHAQHREFPWLVFDQRRHEEKQKNEGEGGKKKKKKKKRLPHLSLPDLAVGVRGTRVTKPNILEKCDESHIFIYFIYFL